MSGRSDYSLEPERTREYLSGKAASVGCTVLYPRGNELQLDIDSEEDLEFFHAQSRLLTEIFDAVEVETLISRSGGRHILVTLPYAIPPAERIALQAVLGSDRKRELLNYRRVVRRDPHPMCLFRPIPATDSYHQHPGQTR